MTTYRIIRFYQDDKRDREVVDTGLTLEEAQRRCKSPEGSSTTATSEVAKAATKAVGAWFEGYEEE